MVFVVWKYIDDTGVAHRIRGMDGLVDGKIVALVVGNYVCLLEKSSAERVLSVVCCLAEWKVVLSPASKRCIWDEWIAEL